MGRRAHNAKCPYCFQSHGANAPWWSKNGYWAVTTGKGRHQPLVKGWEGHDEAIRLWHAAQAARSTPAVVIAQESRGQITLAEVFERYLEGNTHLAAYDDIVNTFSLVADTFGDWTMDRLNESGEATIRRWLQERTTWGPGTKALASVRIKAALNHCKREKIITSNPIAGLNTGRDRWQGKRRVSHFSEEQIAVFFANIPDRGRQFAVACKMLLGTGCRPEEFCNLTAADVRNESGNVYWHVEHKNQHHWGTRRRVYLMERELEEMTTEAAAARESGPIFRNAWGVGWTVLSLREAFRRITARPACKAAGLDDFEPGASAREYRFVPYTFRHTFAFRCISGHYQKDGQPFYMNYGQTADLMGNSASEVEKTYGHIKHSTPSLVSGLKR